MIVECPACGRNVKIKKNSAKEIIFHNKKTKKRFESMIRSYHRLLGDFDFPKRPLDIRRIYDDLTQGEIDPQELPDGDIFRKEAAYILKKSGTGKVVHIGITPESKIISLVEKWLDFMNRHSDIPNIVKAAVGHYYFGYIHPFYDGNGRTSRFISSLYLSKELDPISALSLSRGCNKHKSKYLEAFEITNSIKSRGEMNYFIETFLEMITAALEHMNAELKEKTYLLDTAAKKIKEDPTLKHLTQKHRQFMFVLAQNHFFDSNSGLTVSELSDIFGKSAVTIRKMIKDLLDLSLIIKRGERPAYFSIRDQYFEE